LARKESEWRKLLALTPNTLALVALKFKGLSAERNIEEVGKNSLCIFDREYELATYVHGNPKSDMKDTLEEFFDQFKVTKDTKVETNNEDDVTDDDDLDDSKFDEEENNNT
jgi:hypothetical protein